MEKCAVCRIADLPETSWPNPAASRRHGRSKSLDPKLARQWCYIVRDANGHLLAYVYFEDEPGRRAAARLMTRDEARRIAANIAKLLRGMAS